MKAPSSSNAQALRTSATDSEIAQHVLAALDERRQIDEITGTVADFDVTRAYRVSTLVTSLRQKRGENPLGRKIGFTNSAIWPQYGVYAPIWGMMYDTTICNIADIGGRFDLSPYLEPRIEPEIVLGLTETPQPGMDEAALMDCIGWAAHGFEIVQSLFAAWQFKAADTVAAFALHGAYLMGPRHEIGTNSRRSWFDAFPAFSITLKRDGETVDSGTGANVLGGPLTALRHLVDTLAADGSGVPLKAGECITTGTLTAAYPVNTGQTWRTVIDGLPLDGIEISFA